MARVSYLPSTALRAGFFRSGRRPSNLAQGTAIYVLIKHFFVDFCTKFGIIPKLLARRLTHTALGREFVARHSYIVCRIVYWE